MYKCLKPLSPEIKCAFRVNRREKLLHVCVYNKRCFKFESHNQKFELFFFFLERMNAALQSISDVNSSDPKFLNHYMYVDVKHKFVKDKGVFLCHLFVNVSVYGTTPLHRLWRR